MTTATKKRARKPRAPAGLVQGQVLIHFAPHVFGGRRATVLLPLRTKAPSNSGREMFWALSARSNTERLVTCQWLKQLGDAEWRGDVRLVRFVRLGPKLMDDDNAVASIKSVRDQVAAWRSGDNTPKGRGDDGPCCGVVWEYTQEKLTHFGVRVEIYVAAAGGGDSARVAGPANAAASGT